MKAISMARSIFSTITIAFLLLPLVAILPLAFTASEVLTYPIPGFSLRWFRELVDADVWYRSILNSLVISGGTTILSTIIGTAGALGLRSHIRFSGTLRVMFLLPLVIPAVVLGVGMQLQFVALGIDNTYLCVIIAHTVVAMPFVVICVSSALAGIDQRLELASLSLGANPVATFYHVTLPLMGSGVMSGGVLAFATSLDEVVLTLFVAGPSQRTLARQMFSTIRDNISPAIASSAFIFIVGTIAVVGLMYVLKAKRAQPASP